MGDIIKFPPSAERINRAREKEGLKESTMTMDLCARIDRINNSVRRIQELMAELRNMEEAPNGKSREKDSGR